MANSTGIRIFLIPFSWLYGFIVKLRNELFNFGILKSRTFSFPVIGIGNITVGGTGKTPHVEYLVDMLHSDYKVAVLSRGYKRKTKGFVLAENASSSLDIGDEPKQMKAKFGNKIELAVSEDRVNGIKKLRGQKNFDLLILDDAYQHRYVKPGLNILLVDYYRPIFDDHLLPYGNLRESKYNYDRANIVLVTKCPPNIKPIDQRLFFKNLNLFPYQSIFFTSFAYGGLKPVFDSVNELTIEALKEYAVLLITGIARPLPFKNHLQTKVKELKFLPFGDHYSYKGKDLQKIRQVLEGFKNENKIIVTTEKDAARIKDNSMFEELKNLIYYVPINVVFLDGEEDNFKNKIINYVREDKRNGKLY